jgi:hypothetical protein
MTIKRISEKDCWFVIGAHQAGATERQCAALSGLSKTVIHNIITNFKKMGSPHATTLSMDALLEKGTTTTGKCIGLLVYFPRDLSHTRSFQR